MVDKMSDEELKKLSSLLEDRGYFDDSENDGGNPGEKLYDEFPDDFDDEEEEDSFRIPWWQLISPRLLATYIVCVVLVLVSIVLMFIHGQQPVHTTMKEFEQRAALAVSRVYIGADIDDLDCDVPKNPNKHGFVILTEKDIFPCVYSQPTADGDVVERDLVMEITETSHRRNRIGRMSNPKSSYVLRVTGDGFNRFGLPDSTFDFGEHPPMTHEEYLDSLDEKYAL